MRVDSLFPVQDETARNAGRADITSWILFSRKEIDQADRGISSGLGDNFVDGWSDYSVNYFLNFNQQTKCTHFMSRHLIT